MSGSGRSFKSNTQSGRAGSPSVGGQPNLGTSDTRETKKTGDSRASEAGSDRNSGNFSDDSKSSEAGWNAGRPIFRSDSESSLKSLNKSNVEIDLTHSVKMSFPEISKELVSLSKTLEQRDGPSVSKMLEQRDGPSADVQKAIKHLAETQQPSDKEIGQVREILITHKASNADHRQVGAIAHALIQTAANSAMTFGVGLGAGQAIASLTAESGGFSPVEKAVVKLVVGILTQPFTAAVVNLGHQHSLHRLIQHMPYQFRPVPAKVLVDQKLCDAMNTRELGSGDALRKSIEKEQGRLASLDSFGATVGGVVGFSAAVAAKEVVSLVYTAGYGLGMAGSFVGGTAAGSGLSAEKHRVTMDIPKFKVVAGGESGNGIELELKDGKLVTEKLNLFYAHELTKTEMSAQSQKVADSLPVTRNGNLTSLAGRAKNIGIPFGVALLSNEFVNAFAHRLPLPKVVLPIIRAVIMAVAVVVYFKNFLANIPKTDAKAIGGEKTPQSKLPTVDLTPPKTIATTANNESKNGSI